MPYFDYLLTNYCHKSRVKEQKLKCCVVILAQPNVSEVAIARRFITKIYLGFTQKVRKIKSQFYEVV